MSTDRRRPVRRPRRGRRPAGGRGAGREGPGRGPGPAGPRPGRQERVLRHPGPAARARAGLGRRDAGHRRPGACATHPAFVTGLSPDELVGVLGPRGDALRPGPPGPPGRPGPGAVERRLRPGRQPAPAGGRHRPAAGPADARRGRRTPAWRRASRPRSTTPLLPGPGGSGRRQPGGPRPGRATPAAAARSSTRPGGDPAAVAAGRGRLAGGRRPGPGGGRRPRRVAGRAGPGGRGGPAPAGRLAGGARASSCRATPGTTTRGPGRTAGSLAQGLYLPGLHSEELGDVVLAVDTSGSIDEQMLGLFAAEANAVLGAYDCTVTVLYHDTEVQKVQTWRSADGPLVLEPVGGGGTSHALRVRLARPGRAEPGLRRLPDRPGDRVPAERRRPCPSCGPSPGLPPATRRSAGSSPSSLNPQPNDEGVFP